MLASGQPAAMIAFTHLRRAFVLLALMVAAASGRGAEAGVEFVGFFWDNQTLHFGLRDKSDGRTKWLTAGQEFAGYTPRSLDEKAGVLVVAKDKVEYRLPLIVSKIRQVASEPPPEVKKKILHNLRQLAAAADQYFLENGVSKATYDDLVGPTKYVKKVEAVAGEEYQGMKFEQGKKLEVTTEQGHVISYLP